MVLFLGQIFRLSHGQDPPSSESNMSKVVRIIDATLREGNQCHGASFNEKNSPEIASAIAALGIDMLEIGHPVCSAQEIRRIKSIVELDLGCPILAHSRAHAKDVRAVAETGAQWIGIFVGINEISQKVRISNRQTNQIIKMIKDSVSLAKELGLKVRYTVEDASRTPDDILLQAYSEAINSGADRICYSDTLGILEPNEVCEKISLLKKHFPEIDIEVHFHDDRGLAMANALAAVDAGANWISTSINGIGERSGITDTCAFIANLTYRKKRKFLHLDQLKKVSRLVAAHSRSFVDPRRPLVGKNAFHHKARLHAKAIEKDESSYNWIAPGIFGLTSTTHLPELPRELDKLINIPKVIPASELKYHTDGPGLRYVMVDERFVPDSRQYCIVRKIGLVKGVIAPHVDAHRHDCDSLFMFIGAHENLTGLAVEVQLGDEIFPIKSPSSVFIPAGIEHSYRVIAGEGIYVNHVLSGCYNDSLLEGKLTS